MAELQSKYCSSIGLMIDTFYLMLGSEQLALLSHMAIELKGVNWRELGTHLHVPQAKLDAIQQDHQYTETKLTQVLSYHQRNGEMTWEKINEALKKIGGHANIIKSIKSKYITPGNTLI